MGLRITEVYKKELNQDTGVKRHVVGYVEISFIQRIDQKNAMTQKLLDKIEYLNSNATQGKIDVESFGNEVFINGTLKTPSNSSKIVEEIINCLNALESMKNKLE